MTPDLRSRTCGSTAWATAIVPKVLVSNSSRTVSMRVSSNGAGAPKPALLTSTSMGPADSTALRMLRASGDVELQYPQPGRGRQHVLPRRAHRGQHVPVALQEVARGFQAEAGG